MKIDHIEVINLRHEYPVERRFAYAGGTCTGRLSSLILVHTDRGQTGIGSAYSHPGLVTLIVKQQLEPLLRRRDPCDVEFLTHDTASACRTEAGCFAPAGVDGSTTHDAIGNRERSHTLHEEGTYAEGELILSCYLYYSSTHSLNCSRPFLQTSE
jgi:L-alanine-DL-glutamate epimerase-like enolase superfamily enzyme